MTDKRVVINNGDGTVGILIPAPEMFDATSRTRLLVPELDGKSDEEVLQWIIAKDVPKDKTYRIITTKELPDDRVFRAAWTDDNDTHTVDIDLDRAKEIKKDKFRELRAPLLKDLDIQAIQALEQKQDVTSIVAQKQALRDVTDVELPNTVEELKTFVPDILQIDSAADASSLSVTSGAST